MESGFGDDTSTCLKGGKEVISCIIPTTVRETEYLPHLLLTLLKSAKLCPEDVEIILVENGVKGIAEDIIETLNSPILQYVYLPTASRSLAKNLGVEKAMGNLLVFIDADNLCSLDLFSEVSEKGANPNFFGGGCKSFRVMRGSFGLYCYFTFMLLCFSLKGIFNPLDPFSVGIFWFKRKAYEEIGGWKDVNLRDLTKILSFVPEMYQPADDIDLGMKMKMYERKVGLKFESLKQTIHLWNTRKFDKYGDWSWIGVYKRR
jgi:glycosyltransferase involved in cell wall biosynthesis